MDNYRYTAKSRIPIRPLSYENASLALPKELIMDYKNAKIYICDLSGNIINITEKMLTEINEMIKENLKSNETEEVVKDIDITLDNGTVITIERGIVDAFIKLDQLNTNLNDFKSYINNEVIPAIPSKSTSTPLASKENGSIGSDTKKYALADHVHPKGLATVADSANSVEWSNVKNHPDFSETSHNHDTTYFKLSGGDITGELGFKNNKSLYGHTTANAKAYMIHIDTSNRIHIGLSNKNPILLDAKVILNSANYGEADPQVSGAVKGQVYFQLI